MLQEFRFIDIERSMNAINRLIKIPINVVQLLKSTNWSVIKEIIKEGKKKKRMCLFSYSFVREEKKIKWKLGNKLTRNYIVSEE